MQLPGLECGYRACTQNGVSGLLASACHGRMGPEVESGHKREANDGGALSGMSLFLKPWPQAHMQIASP